MITKGIRGAVTVEENTTDAIKSATLELLSEMIKVNNIETDMICLLYTSPSPRD